MVQLTCPPPCMCHVTQDANLQYLTPRIREWMDSLPLPGDQRSAVGRALESNGYTSMYFIVGENVQQLIALPHIAALTPGARAAVRRLAERTVRCSCSSHSFYTYIHTYMCRAAVRTLAERSLRGSCSLLQCSFLARFCSATFSFHCCSATSSFHCRNATSSFHGAWPVLVWMLCTYTDVPYMHIWPLFLRRMCLPHLLKRLLLPVHIY